MRFVQRECIARVYFNNVPYWKGQFINMLHDIIRATDERKSVIFGPLTYHVMTSVKYCYAAKCWSLPTSGFLAWILVPSLNSVELCNRSPRARIISQ